MIRQAISETEKLTLKTARQRESNEHRFWLKKVHLSPFPLLRSRTTMWKAWVCREVSPKRLRTPMEDLKAFISD